MTRRKAAWIAGVLVVVVAACDYLVGTEVSFSIFYLLPISVTSWYVGRWWGLLVSLISAATWLANDTWFGGHPYSEAWIPYWNTAMRLMIGPVRVEELLSDLTLTMRSPAAEQGIALVHETSPDLPSARADAARVRQVVTNLLENALKFTPTGGKVALRATRYGEEFLCISVEDTGRGISLDAQKRLFQRLYQTEAEDSGSRRGLGLGLFISREIVSRHGGRIWVESVPAQGSTFHFTLPVVSEER